MSQSTEPVSPSAAKEAEELRCALYELAEFCPSMDHVSIARVRKTIGNLQAENARLSAALAEKEKELETWHAYSLGKDAQALIDAWFRLGGFTADPSLGRLQGAIQQQLASQQEALVEKEKELDAAKEECLEYNHACVHLDKFLPWAGVSNPERIKNVAAMFAAQKEALVEEKMYSETSRKDFEAAHRKLLDFQSALVAARDALFPLAHVATFAERLKDATGIWNHSDTHGPSFVLTVGHCRDAQKALARVNACLPEGAK